MRNPIFWHCVSVPFTHVILSPRIVFTSASVFDATWPFWKIPAAYKPCTVNGDNSSWEKVMQSESLDCVCVRIVPSFKMLRPFVVPRKSSTTHMPYMFISLIICLHKLSYRNSLKSQKWNLQLKNWVRANSNWNARIENRSTHLDANLFSIKFTLHTCIVFSVNRLYSASFFCWAIVEFVVGDTIAAVTWPFIRWWTLVCTSVAIVLLVSSSASIDAWTS